MKKVLVASLQRCGTQSTTKFLEKSHGRSIQFSPALASSNFYGKNLLDIREHSRPYEQGFSVFSNAPYFALYEEFAQDYPSMSFVLITRKEQDWLRSFRQLIKSFGIDSMSMAALEKYLPDIRKRYSSNSLSDDDLLYIYRTHNQRVIDFFGESKRFIHLDLYDSDIGRKLSNFLGHDTHTFEKIDNANIY